MVGSWGWMKVVMLVDQMVEMLEMTMVEMKVMKMVEC